MRCISGVLKLLCSSLLSYSPIGSRPFQLLRVRFRHIKAHIRGSYSVQLHCASYQDLRISEYVHSTRTAIPWFSSLKEITNTTLTYVVHLMETALVEILHFQVTDILWVTRFHA
jgi:hypothetical protein